MSSNDDSGNGNVISFGRRTGLTGFNLTPVPPGTDRGTLGPVIPPEPADPPTSGTGGRVRRSPLDSLAALPSPTLTAAPAVTTASPSGGLPDTFRNGDGGAVAPRLGALSMAAILAVAVAALRGSCTLLEDRRQRRMARDLENAPLKAARLKHRLAMTEHGYGAEEAAAKHGLDAQKAHGKHANAMRGIGGKAAEQRAKNNSKVPSGTEFGRKTLGGRGGASGSRGKGAGSSGSGSGAGAGSGRGSKGAGPGAGKKTSGSTAGRSGATSPSAGFGGGAKKSAGKTSAGSGSAGKGPGKGPGFGKGTGAGLKKPNGKSTGLSTTGGKGAGGSAAKKTPAKQSPLNGKAASTKASSPAMERARRRQDRRDNGQGARLQRRADRGAARTREKAKDNKAAREHKYAAKKTRSDAKQRIRDARRAAEEARKERLRDDKFTEQQLRRQQRVADKQARKDADVTFWRAAAETARRRLDKRRKDLIKKRRKSKKTTPAGASQGAAGTAQQTTPPTGPSTHPPGAGKTPPKPPGPGQKTPPKPSGAGTQAPPAASGARGPKSARSKAHSRARQATGSTGSGFGGGCFGGASAPPRASTATPPGGAGGSPGGSHTGTRRSPYGNTAAGQATPADPPTYEWPKHPTRQPKTGPDAAIGRGIDALPPAPEPHTARPGTSRPKEAHQMPPAIVPAQDPLLQQARHSAARRAHAVVTQARHMDAQHATEITLDDAIDEYDDFRDDGFATHTQSHKLAGRARKLASILEAFAEKLAVSNNLIGALFTDAMAGLSEDMELLSATADEMESSSLEAAESAEAESNDLNDAYRPISDATADAGLTTPSAPAHNQS